MKGKSDIEFTVLDEGSEVNIRTCFVGSFGWFTRKNFFSL